MPLTKTNLYRLGNATSPRLNNVRVGIDILTYENNGVAWVRANSGGVSTFSQASGNKNEWRLNSGYPYSFNLNVVNDHGNHYNWQPNQDMPLTDFITLLTAVNPAFTKIS